MVLFIMLYKVALALSLWMKPWCVTIQLKAIEEYFHVVLFITPSKVAFNCYLHGKSLPSSSIEVERQLILPTVVASEIVTVLFENWNVDVISFTALTYTVTMTTVT